MFFRIFLVFSFLTLPVFSAEPGIIELLNLRAQGRDISDALVEQNVHLVQSAIFSAKTLKELRESEEKLQQKLKTNSFPKVLVINSAKAAQELLSSFQILDLSVAEFKKNVERKFEYWKIQSIVLAIGDYSFSFYPVYGEVDGEFRGIFNTGVFNNGRVHLFAPEVFKIESLILSLLGDDLEKRLLPIRNIKVFEKSSLDDQTESFHKRTIIDLAFLYSRFGSERLNRFMFWEPTLEAAKSLNGLNVELEFHFYAKHYENMLKVSWDDHEAWVSTAEIDSEVKTLYRFAENSVLYNPEKFRDFRKRTSALFYILAAFNLANQVITDCAYNLRPQVNRMY